MKIVSTPENLLRLPALLLIGCLMACEGGSSVEQAKLPSSLQGVLDAPVGQLVRQAGAVAPLTPQMATEGPIDVLEEDTIYADGYLLHFAAAADSSFSPYFPDQEERSAISAQEQNWYKATLMVEEYLKAQNQHHFSATDSSITLFLAAGDALELPRWENDADAGEEASYSFEHYFPEAGFFLLRTQFGEGNCWMLVSRDTGKKTYIPGLPYFSPDGRQVMTANLDLEAGYSYNGLSLYSIRADSLSLNWQLEINNWGPKNMKWVSDTSLLIEKAYWVQEDDQQVWKEASTQLHMSPQAAHR